VRTPTTRTRRVLSSVESSSEQQLPIFLIEK
jgi:hypothetical protein